MKIVQMSEGASFDAETTSAMGEAFDDASRSLQEFGARVTVREIIARRIIEAAKNGEQNRERLCDHALLAFDMSVLISAGRIFPVAATPPIMQKA